MKKNHRGRRLASARWTFAFEKSVPVGGEWRFAQSPSFVSVAHDRISRRKNMIESPKVRPESRGLDFGIMCCKFAVSHV